ncbi:MAG: hypothetical protein ACU84H_09225 [Gammaproteobacteria bacterium]
MKAKITHEQIRAALNNRKELAAFCSQNGRIINDSIEYEILEQSDDSVLIYVTFLESIMEGSGCQADQKSCYGRLRLKLNDSGVICAVVVC